MGILEEPCVPGSGCEVTAHRQTSMELCASGWSHSHNVPCPELTSACALGSPALAFSRTSSKGISVSPAKEGGDGRSQSGSLAASTAQAQQAPGGPRSGHSPLGGSQHSLGLMEVSMVNGESGCRPEPHCCPGPQLEFQKDPGALVCKPLS